MDGTDFLHNILGQSYNFLYRLLNIIVNITADSSNIELGIMTTNIVCIIGWIICVWAYNADLPRL